MADLSKIEQAPGSGIFANGMRYVTWGSGPKTLLFLSGVQAPKGMLLRMFRWLLAPYVKAGFAVWIVGRRHPMPLGYTVADMAQDYARVITENLGGRADLVVGESTGGMIAQYLAALHPKSFGTIALVVAAAEMTDVGKDGTLRSATALVRGDRGGAGTVAAEFVVSGERMWWLRKLLGPVIGRLMLPNDDPPEDILAEAQALDAFDSRPVLPSIQVPVLLICSDRDVFFSNEVIEETARLIPDCTLIWYRGQSHWKVAFSNRQVAHDVLAFVSRE